MINKHDLQDMARVAFVSPNEADSNFEAANVVDGLFAIARAIDHLARSVNNLGNADAATPMGGMEALGLVFKEGFQTLADSITDLKERH